MGSILVLVRKRFDEYSGTKGDSCCTRVFGMVDGFLLPRLTAIKRTASDYGDLGVIWILILLSLGADREQNKTEFTSDNELCPSDVVHHII